MPHLTELDVSGASEGNISGFESTESLDIDVSGASSINGEIEAASVVFELSGASSARLTGSAGDAMVKASGASRLLLADLMINDADVTLTGASTADINLDGRLDVSLSGASSLNFKGTPTMGRIEISGGSSINQE